MITAEYPTPIVEDFRTYLNHLTSYPIKLTKAKGYFTKKDLLVLYPQMKSDKNEVPQQATQIGYPIIHLFYHLSLALDFIRIQRSSSSAAALIQHEHIEQFMNLTTTEQYVTLLEAFWNDTDWNELQGEKWNKAPRNIDFLFEELGHFSANKVIELKKCKEIARDVSEYGQFFHYFTYFGFWTFVFDEEQSNRPDIPKSTKAKSICLTPFFKKIQDALLEAWDQNQADPFGQSFDFLASLFVFSDEMSEEEHEEHEEEEQETKSLIELLKPLFPSGELTGTLKKSPLSSITGTYHFKVKLSSSCWRVLQLSSKHTLLDLHHLIQEAFQFDDDHLYAFYMDGKKYGKHYYNALMDHSGPYVNEAKIGDLYLYEGQGFLYLFDFGDEWEFDIQVVKIIEGETNAEQKVLKEHGEAPDQYGW